MRHGTVILFYSFYFCYFNFLKGIFDLGYLYCQNNYFFNKI